MNQFSSQGRLTLPVYKLGDRYITYNILRLSQKVKGAYFKRITSHWHYSESLITTRKKNCFSVPYRGKAPAQSIHRSSSLNRSWLHSSRTWWRWAALPEGWELGAGKVRDVIRFPLAFRQSGAITLKEKYQQLGELWNSLHCISERNQGIGWLLATPAW